MLKANLLKVTSPVFWVMASFLVFACGGLKDKATTKEEGPASELASTTADLEPVYEVSPQTKMLLKTLKNELRASGQSLESYEPSPKVMEKYRIQQDSSEYYIQGMLVTNADFVEKEFEGLLQSNAGPNKTIRLKLDQLPRLLSASGIEYFGISEKVNLK